MNVYVSSASSMLNAETTTKERATMHSISYSHGAYGWTGSLILGMLTSSNAL